MNKLFSEFDKNIASVKLAEKLGFELNDKENNKLIFVKKLDKKQLP